MENQISTLADLALQTGNFTAIGARAVMFSNTKSRCRAYTELINRYITAAKANDGFYGQECVENH